MVQQRTPRQSWSKILPKATLALLLAALSAGSVGGCSEPVPFHRNPVAILPPGSLTREWFVDLQLTKDPIVNIDVRDKLVYVYTQSKEVIGFDRQAGTLKMTMQVNNPGPRLRPLVELKDRIVFPNPTSIEVFDGEGYFEKSIPLNVPLRSNASGDGETIYFGSVGPHGGLVESYDVSQPYAPQRWEFLTRDTGDVTAGTADYGGVVYSGSQLGEVDAVTSERNQIWDTDHGNFLVSGPITADLVVDESGVYVASNDTKLYCIDRRIGKLKWQYFSGQPLIDAPVTTPDSVYQYVPRKGLVALDKLSGPFNRTPRWIHPTATQFLAQDEKYAYLADPRPTADDKGHTGYAIIAVDKQTMKYAFESDHKDFSIFGTNRKDSLIYAGFPDGKFFAIRPVIKAGKIGELVMVPVTNAVALAQ